MRTSSLRMIRVIVLGWVGWTYKWYFVRCQSGREDSIRKQLETRIQLKGLQDASPRCSCPSSASPT